MDEVIAEWVNIMFREGWMKKENQVCRHCSTKCEPNI